MILGLGTDLIEIPRIRQSVERFGDRFLERVFTPREIAYCQRKRTGMAQSLAARFAAKEAGAKALGTGIARGILLSEIEVQNLPSGQPTILFHGRAALRAQHLGVLSTTLSLTHSRDLAMAVVLLEGDSISGITARNTLESPKLAPKS